MSETQHDGRNFKNSSGFLSSTLSYIDKASQTAKLNNKAI